MRVGGVPHTNKGLLCKQQPQILPLKPAPVPHVPTTPLLFGSAGRQRRAVHSQVTKFNTE